MNTLKESKRAQVVAALVEGNSINATVRMTGVAKHTVLNLLRDLGAACAEFHHQNVRGVRVRRLQCDEEILFTGNSCWQTLKVTPAMEAGLTDHVWTIAELCALIPEATVSKSSIERDMLIKALGTVGASQSGTEMTNGRF
jgi:hypothetical protein